MRLKYMLHTAALAVVTAVVAAPVVEIAVPSEPNASEIAAKDELKELVGTDPVCDAENLQWIGDVF